MSNKTLIIIIILILVVILGIAISVGGLVGQGNAFVLNGTISQCTYQGKTLYQYVPNSYGATPVHYSASGDLVACTFSGSRPDEACVKVLAELRSCKPIYRTNKDLRSLPPLYGPGADVAVKILSGKGVK